MSEEQDDSQKTEEPTEKRIKESREKGQVAISKEVNHWMMLLALLIIALMIIPYSFGGIKDSLRILLEKGATLSLDNGTLANTLQGTLGNLLLYLAMPLLFLIIAAIAGPLFQVGPLWSPTSLQPKLERISIMKGVKRLFSLKSIAEFIKSLLKLALVAIVMCIILYPMFSSLDHLVISNIPDILNETTYIIIKLLIGVLSVMTIVAGLDLLYQKYEHNKELMMSHQELKEEYKQTEGDPHVKGKIRQLRQERANKRMMAKVPDADVVITNPTHYAIALEYNPDEMLAPTVVAKGQDFIAQNIKKLAKEHNIPIVENKPLARALYDTAELDDTIPTEHFKAVAQIISYVFKLKGKKF